jgi:hypothetical protein
MSDSGWVWLDRLITLLEIGEEDGEWILPAPVSAMVKEAHAALAAHVWARLEAHPEFNEEMEQARRDIESGHGTPLSEIQRS